MNPSRTKPLRSYNREMDEKPNPLEFEMAVIALAAILLPTFLMAIPAVGGGIYGALSIWLAVRWIGRFTAQHAKRPP